MPTVLEAPPDPPDVFRTSGNDGDGGKPPWQLWVALALLSASATGLSFAGTRAIKWQPVAAIVSLAWAIIWFTAAQRRFYISDGDRSVAIMLWTIVGGFAAEAIQILVSGGFHLGILWVVIGVIGIGGGFGVGSVSIVTAWHTTISLARLLFNWRAT